MALSTSRMAVERGRPPGKTGIRGSTSFHCSSVRSLGYRWVRIPHFKQLSPPYRTDSKADACHALRPDFCSNYPLARKLCLLWPIRGYLGSDQQYKADWQEGDP